MPDPSLSRREALLQQLRSQFRQATGADQDIDLDAPRLRPPTTRERLTGPVRDLLASLVEQPAVQVPLGLMGDIGQLLAPLGARPDVAEMYQMGEVPTGPKAVLAAGAEAAAAKAAKPPIRAYHGSPYDFEKFSLEHVGSGEGKQVRGHGLYFAENPKVAEEYRMAARRTKASPSENMIVNMFQNRKAAGLSDEAALQQTKDWASQNPQLGPELAEKVLPNVEALKALRGRMYEVDIHADPEAMLHWDKRFRDQPPAVREAFKKDWLASLKPEEHQTGGDIYDALAAQHGSESFASADLREAGIPGIRYLDAGSRAAGEGTSNYVIFDESKIDILRKLALLLGIGGAGAAAGQEGAR